MKRLIECLMICVKNSELCRIEANGANKKREREGEREGEGERLLGVGIEATTNVGRYLEEV